MTTSSAEPARLEAYPDQLSAADDQLGTIASDLDSAMGAFARGAGPYRPAGFDADYCGNLFRGFRDESRHLANWVLSIARAFRAADSDPDGDGIFSASDSFIDASVGQATIAGQRAEVEGREAAHELTTELLEMGIDPTNFTPEQLHNLIAGLGDENIQRLYQQMQGIADNMSDPAYATGFYDVMGAEGIRTTLGVVDTFAFIQRDLAGADDWMGSVQDELLAPFVGGWALATRSPETEDERADLLNTTNSIEQRHLSLLMSGDPADYDAQWLADGADRILVTGAHLNQAQVPHEYPEALRPEDYPGFAWGQTEWLYDDSALGLPTVVATRALDGNHEAALNFMQRGPDRVHALAYPEPLPIPADGYLDEEAVRYRDEIQSRSANIVEYGVTHPDEATRTEIMEHAIEAVGTEDARLNSHMFDALAAGVEENMALIDEHINSGWHPDGNSYEIDPRSDEATQLRTTESFLSELMDDADPNDRNDAADRVRRATRDYVERGINALESHPGDDPGQIERSNAEMHDLGRILGVTTEAEIHSIERAYEEGKSEAELEGRFVDYVTGWIPGLGQVNDATQIGDVSVGKLITMGDMPDKEAFRNKMQDVALESEDAIGELPVGMDDADALRSGWLEVRNFVF
jgi:hypothetical protein